MVNYFGDETPLRVVGDRVVFPIRRWQMLVMVGLLAALTVGLGSAGLILAATEGNWLGAGTAFGVAAAIGFLAFRTTRIGLEADATGVTIREQVRTIRLQWADIAEFRGAALDPSRAPAPTILLTDGSVVRITVAARARWERDSRFDHLASELNELHARLRPSRRTDRS